MSPHVPLCRRTLHWAAGGFHGLAERLPSTATRAIRSRHTYVIPSANHHARSATFGEAGPFTNRSGDRHLITLNKRRAT